jgi:hypothetical protein
MHRLLRSVILLFTFCLLPFALPARATSYGYLLSWQSPAPLTQPIVVAATGATVTNDVREPPAAPTHGTIAILAALRCWTVTLASGDFRQEWSERVDCLPARVDLPTLTARWTSPHAAAITWQSSADLVCLYRETREGWRYFLQCYAGGSGEITLPGPPPADWTHHPQQGDTYIADFDGVRVRALLTSPVWLPVVGNGIEPLRVWLPMVRQE